MAGVFVHPGQGMAVDWQDAHKAIAELMATVHETRHRRLSVEEAARLRAAFELLDDVKRELSKSPPPIERGRSEVRSRARRP